tara:strand:+ start:1200 stop:2474 length:1275 start_codon:yes stop_codon:yes gene_type:complete
MSNFIEKSVQEIFDESMANAFIREKVEPVVEVEETFRSTLASRIETDRKEKYEEEQRLIEIEEKKMYKGENATTSDEKNKEIVEKSVKNTITINPDIKETIVGKIYAAYNDRYLAEKKAKKDYDGDGKVESGAKEYRGVIHNKIQQKKGGKADGQDTSSVKEGMATPESGTGKYYREGKPTAKQLEVRAKQDKIRAASNKGKMYKEETIVDEGVLVNLAKGTEKAVGQGVKKFNKFDAKVTKAAKKQAGKLAKGAGKVAKKTLAATGRGMAGAVGGAIKGAYQGASKGVKKGLKETALEILEKSRLAALEEKKGSLKQARKNVGASTCWDGYKATGTKMKDGKQVPDCKKEDVAYENRQVAYEPEKHKDPDESDKPYHKRSRAARMRDPKRGINSPAFKKFMADRGMSASYEPTLPMLESKKKL